MTDFLTSSGYARYSFCPTIPYTIFLKQKPAKETRPLPACNLLLTFSQLLQLQECDAVGHIHMNGRPVHNQSLIFNVNLEEGQVIGLMI